MTPPTNKFDKSPRLARRSPGAKETGPEKRTTPLRAAPPVVPSPTPEPEVAEAPAAAPAATPEPAPKVPTPSAPEPKAAAVATPYTVRLPSDVATSWRDLVAEAGVSQVDAVSAAFGAFLAMDVDEFTAAVLADKRRRKRAAQG